ncbi:cell division protein CrgA [Desertihabitans brevis]|uniref:Cell division protein CrgA n=1 Tax=Desertihabitans brevis TaxID=2268447 RepID=A0A367YRH6_9ACTN|nr:cell division protein CrgA [Desertihabitans brevis]RCK68400.1 cell division protein CrgA [Desertihabitans brevis]
MAESKVRKKAGARKQRDAQTSTPRVKAPGSRRWVPPVFITVGLLGAAWLVIYYIAGRQIPFMGDLGNWNILIGMGLMASSFVIATQWR